MKRLTPIEHAKAKGRTVTMSMPDRGPDFRTCASNWLERRASDGWFYVQGDNYAFEKPADAAAFKQWLMAELAA
ncbi:hypothetical protein D3C87_1441550 [compost metagenome]